MSKLYFFLLSTVSLVISAFVIPGVRLANFASALVAVIMISLVNIFIKPVLQLLAFPLNIFTLGLFSLVVNGLLFLLVAAIVPGFEIANLWWAILMAVVYSIITAFLAYIFDE